MRLLTDADYHPLRINRQWIRPTIAQDCCLVVVNLWSVSLHTNRMIRAFFLLNIALMAVFVSHTVMAAEKFSQKNWQADADGSHSKAFTFSTQYKGHALYVIFNKSKGCEPIVGYGFPQKGSAGVEQPYSRKMTFITGQKNWSVKSNTATYQTNDKGDWADIYFKANMEFVAAIAKRSSLVIDFEGTGKDKFSLAGSWASIVWALDQCKAQQTSAQFNPAPVPSPANQPAKTGVTQNQPSAGSQNKPRVGFCGTCQPPNDATRAELEKVARFEGQGADGFLSNFTFMNSLGDWPYQCNGDKCYLDKEDVPAPTSGSQSQPNSEKQAIATIGPACWSREYSTSHLRSQPKQVVASMWLEFDADPSGKNASASMKVLTSQINRLRQTGDNGQMFAQGFFCADATCSADMDSGVIALTLVDANTLDVKTNRLLVWGDAEQSVDIAETPDQYVTYRLKRSVADVCKK